jgi:hypothetical protein
MPSNTKISFASANAQADAMGAVLNGGYIRLYADAQAADADAAPAGAIVAVLRFGTPAFAAAVNGVITANALTGESNAAGGTALWFRTFRANGTTAGWDGNVGTTDEDMVLESNVIPPGAQVSVTDLTYTVPRSAP